MNKIDWQNYHGLIDEEMVTLTDLIKIFNGKITSVETIKSHNKLNIRSIIGLVKGIGYKMDKKVGNYKFNK